MYIETLSQKTKDYLSTFEEKAKEPPLGAKKRVVLKSRQDFLDEMILKNAQHDTPSKLPPSVTLEQIAEERQRRLNALTTRHRVIFSQWPRDPDTKEFIKPENSLVGKTTGNGLQLWGATMFDFYTVLRHPSIPNLRTLSVGSKLLEWVKKVGEDYKLARSTYEWVEREEVPKTFEPCDIEVLVQEGEAVMRRCMDSGEIKAYEAKEWEESEAERKQEAELKKKKEEELVAMLDFRYTSGPKEGEQESASGLNDIEMKEAEAEEQSKQQARGLADISNEILNIGEENTMEKKPDNEEKKNPEFLIPTDKMDGFSVMGVKLVDWEQEHVPEKSDEMEITDSTLEDDEAAKMTSEPNDVEVKDESEQSLASESKDADIQEEEPATESKSVDHFEAEKNTPEAKDFPLPKDEGTDFPENHKIVRILDLYPSIVD